MKLNLISNRLIKGRIYPALARHEARPYTQGWREFGSHYPYTVPLRLQEYCDHHAVKLNVYTAEQSYPANSFYPVGLGFFDFDIDYFRLLPETIFAAVKEQRLRVLFYYHEGDNPLRIKHRLDALLVQHQLPERSYVFVSANTAADNIAGFVYFTDFELWYWQRNHQQSAVNIHTRARSKDFTVLNRLHKSWRATAMTDLKRNHLLDRAYWSYCESGQLDTENPIEIDSIPQLAYDAERFLTAAPYFADTLSQDERNNHALTDERYHSDAYCNIVMETHFDADQSGGAFITEKTFKPIKHGQLLIVAGPAGSLQTLRDLGYRTFDSVLDNRYDDITDNTERWIAVRKTVQQAQHNIRERYLAALEDIKYNQQLFQSLKTERLNNLIRKIHEQTS